MTDFETMKNTRLPATLSSTLLLFPFLGFAQLENTGTPIVLHFAYFLIILVLLFTLKIDWMKKGIILAVYLLTSFFIIQYMVRHDELYNEKWRTIISALLPPLVVYLTYLGVNSKKRKSENPG